MKRELRTICLNATSADFEKLYKLCNSLFPRHKHKGYLKENGNYDLFWNVSEKEYKLLFQEYTMMVVNELF